MSWPKLEVLAQKVKSGEVTSLELVEKSLKLIDEHREYNAIISVVESARDEARKIDAKIANGEDVGLLAGIPFIAKDNFLTAGTNTTAASNILDGFNPPYSATAVEKLTDAGAVLVAKANLDSFAHGSSTENSDFGPTLNPADKSRVPGGSSGGSAAAVVLGLAPFSIGTDTGGSIRQPASFTGSVGLKPTYGLISRFGVVAMASSTDVIGPITSTVDDAALVLEVISGQDKRDATTIERDKTPYTNLEGELTGLTFGLIKEHTGEGLDPGVRANMQSAVEQIEAAGGKVEEISMPSLDLALAVYYIVMPAEVTSNLSRYDGIRFGYSSPDSHDLDTTYDFTRSQGFNSEVKRRILIGTYVLSSGYYDAYYTKAQTVRTKLIDDFNKAFQKFDALIGPTAPTPAFEFGANADDPLSMYLSDIMTVGANLVGIPAISIPMGHANDLPVGLQIMCPQKHDRKLLSIAKNVESELAKKTEVIA
jgi:aspartyl-tRNA(Asn)/glutamyl-tRNA(Gln) amidotransferase subunit A